MRKDKRGVLRGKCTECDECDEYESSGDILCEYCGHRPVQHTLNSDNEPPPKRTKQAEINDEATEVQVLSDAKDVEFGIETQERENLVSTNQGFILFPMRKYSHLHLAAWY